MKHNILWVNVILTWVWQFLGFFCGGLPLRSIVQYIIVYVMGYSVWCWKILENSQVKTTFSSLRLVSWDSILLPDQTMRLLIVIYIQCDIYLYPREFMTWFKGYWSIVCVCFCILTEQAVYNRPQPADKTRSKEGKDTIEAYQLAQRLQSMVSQKYKATCDSVRVFFDFQFPCKAFLSLLWSVDLTVWAVVLVWERDACEIPFYYAVGFQSSLSFLQGTFKTSEICRPALAGKYWSFLLACC